ncbi:WD40-like Beta Propeller Repeat [Hymenobacter daecheongensis DSM 21074]|uniref:WD40-like Beta Propeller Repeat n=1 Tax=Hymenobacter daecheongensis DSM 21074 TaxID=1121955 RepID=A0A1M6IL02_9BACT|nr:OmpA family protein [Hymenobacter daecheongensis]SHJ35110.1 WD40-like Beta Propeller Repeat [Hymenobacter daecheongensis DSM 21074]
MIVRKLFLSLGLVLGGAGLTQAQHAIWAAKVVGVSSQKAEGKEAFSPEKVLGEPNAQPLGQISNDAWIPKKEGTNEFIEVRFGKSLVAKQVTVIENFNPGSVIKIELVDTRGTKHQIYTNDSPGPIPEQFRSLQATFPAATYRTIGVVVTMNTKAVNGVNQIDAIGIADVAEVMVKKEFANVAPEGSVRFDSAMVNLGPNVNSKYVDTHPVISPDGKTLFFARQESPQNVGGSKDGQDVWYSTLANAAKKSWNPAKNIGGPINTPGPNGLASVSSDGNSAVLINVYRPDGSLDPKGVSTVRRTKTGWGMPVKMEIEDFYNDDPDHVDYFLATSGKALLMAVARKDGKGEQDIYVSFPKPDGGWSRPKNLGSAVNTKKPEFAPFLAADGKTLYFASEGHTGYGNADIFYSKRLDDTWTNWSAPRNLGTSINSPDFDGYFTLAASGEDAYLVSSRKGIDNSRDIFRINLTPQFKPEVVTLVRGRVLDAATQKPVAATIRYENLLTGEEIGVAETSPVDGSYTIVLPSGAHYGYRAESPNYLAESDNLDATDKQKYSEITQDLFLVPFAVGSTIKLNNIFFTQSKYYLRDNSYPELLRLVRILKDYPGVEIKLEGHTDNQGDPALNVKLSLDRVNEVKKYLVSKGIPGNRIATEGFGGSKPIASNEKEETRKLNRRVEFRITKK